MRRHDLVPDQETTEGLFFLAASLNVWDPRSLTRDGTQVLCIGR